MIEGGKRSATPVMLRKLAMALRLEVDASPGRRPKAR